MSPTCLPCWWASSRRTAHSRLYRSCYPPSLPPLLQVLVGIITPYRSQRDLIKETFIRRFGREVAEEVRIETVDSFQVGA